MRGAVLMKKYDLISLVALLILVAALPFYLVREYDRMNQGQVALRQQYVVDGAVLYIDNCVLCHGLDGTGVGAMPALDSLAGADTDVLHRTIAHSPHGSAMASWHLDEGGVLNDYQVAGLVTLIQSADWERVGELASARGVDAPTPTVPEVGVDMSLLEEGEGDPHECRACHEEPSVHADRFGLNCARCHTLQAWKPALLTRHTFMLDHGGEGNVDCQTCHTYTYSEHTCYECHDHTPEQMEEVHAQEEIFEFENCVVCHPTGQEGEGKIYRDNYGNEGEDGGDIDVYQEVKGDVLIQEISQNNVGR